MLVIFGMVVEMGYSSAPLSSYQPLTYLCPTLSPCAHVDEMGLAANAVEAKQ